MSENITVTIKGQRGTPPVLTTVATNSVWQLDKVEAVESTGYSQAEPHYTYEAYNTTLPTSNPTLLQEGDMFIDTVRIDSNTGTFRTWRITDDPEPFPLDNHWEVLLYRYRGK